MDDTKRRDYKQNTLVFWLPPMTSEVGPKSSWMCYTHLTTAQKSFKTFAAQKVLEGWYFYWIAKSSKLSAVYIQSSRFCATQRPQLCSKVAQIRCDLRSWVLYVIGEIGRSYWRATRGNWHIPQVVIRIYGDIQRFSSMSHHSRKLIDHWSLDWMCLPRNPPRFKREQRILDFPPIL